MPLNNFEYQIIEMIESVKAHGKLGPLVLGGPPGGYVGYLPQTRVEYDPFEIGTSGTSASASLLDNLNHIRYRIGTLESGAVSPLTVEWETIPVEEEVVVLNFTGAVEVTSFDPGVVNIDIQASGGSGTPGGNNTNVQVNISGVFYGDDYFIYSPNEKVVIIGAPTVPIPGTNTIHNISEGTISPANFLWAFGTDTAGFLTGMAAGGTKDIPSGVLDGRSLLKIRGRGYDGGGYSPTQVEQRFVVVGDWSISNHGTKQEFYITPSGSTGLELSVSIVEDGIDVPSGKTYHVNNTPLNYGHISSNDPDTNVTGAELETLSDGSFASSLHKHKSIQLTFTHGGNAGVPSPAGTTRYLGFEDVTSGLQTAVYNITIPIACEMRNLYINTNSAQPGTGSLVFTMIRNSSVSTALAVTVSAGGGAGLYSNTSDVVSLSAGDAITLKVVNNASSTSANIIRCSLELDIPTLIA